MLKKGLLSGLILILSCLSAFAADETLITTYYPSPYGYYKELKVNRSVTYAPVTSLPGDGKEGELVFFNNDKKFYYYSGGWKVLGAPEVVTLIDNFKKNYPPTAGCPVDWTIPPYTIPPEAQYVIVAAKTSTECVITHVYYQGVGYDIPEEGWNPLHHISILIPANGGGELRVCPRYGNGSGLGAASVSAHSVYYIK